MTWIIIAVVAVVVLWFVGSYNGFIRAKGAVDEAFSGMDVYLKKRYDLIPNLVNTVKAYMTHEKETLESVVNLRNQAVDPSATPAEKMNTENQLTQTISHLFALAENYPELKADTQFTQLQTELSTLETDISEARKYYNGAAKIFNIKTQTVPSNIIASIFKFKAVPYFEVDNVEERKNVKVEF